MRSKCLKVDKTFKKNEFFSRQINVGNKMFGRGSATRGEHKGLPQVLARCQRWASWRCYVFEGLFLIKSNHLPFSDFLLAQIMPYEVTYGMMDKEFDEQARLITAEYTKFFVVCVYVPNSGRKLVNLNKREIWDVKFQEYLAKLNQRKGVIICGDMNVSHLEIGMLSRVSGIYENRMPN